VPYDEDLRKKVKILNVFLYVNLIQSEMLWIAATQLSEYLQGTRQSFDLPFNFKGTDFQKVSINLLGLHQANFAQGLLEWALKDSLW